MVALMDQYILAVLFVSQNDCSLILISDSSVNLLEEHHDQLKLGQVGSHFWGKGSHCTDFLVKSDHKA